MAEKIETIKYQKSELQNKYLKAIDQGDFYTATLTYNRIKSLLYENPNSSYMEESTEEDEFLGELELKQSYIYATIGSQFSETDHLLRLASNKNFYKYNPRAVAFRLSMFFNVYYEQDCLNYYINMFKSRGKEFASIDMQTQLNENWNKSIHFVEEDGFYKMGEAIKQVTQGKTDLAIEAVNDIDEKDGTYTKAQNFKASLLVVRHQFDEAKKILINLVELKKADEETFKALFCLPNLTEDEAWWTVNQIEELRGDENQTDAFALVEASLLLKLNESEKALQLLNSVTSNTRFEESFLTLKVKCHAKIGDIDGLKEALKTLYIMYPSDPTARLALIKLEQGEEFELDPYISSRTTKSIKKEARRYIANELKKIKDFNSESAGHVEFLLKLAEESGDFSILRRVTRLVLHSKYWHIVQDLLLSVYTNPQNIQIMLQVIIEEKSKREWSLLQFSLLKSIKVNYPEFFMLKANDIEKYNFLLSTFAQSLTLALFEGADISQFGTLINGLIEKLYETDLGAFPALKYSDNLTFLMLTYAYPGDKMLTDIFYKMPEELKTEILKFLE